MRRGIKFQIMTRLLLTALVVMLGFAVILYYFFSAATVNNLIRRGGQEAQRNLLLVQSAVESVYRMSESLSLNEDVARFLAGAPSFTGSERVLAAGKLMDKLSLSLQGSDYIHSFCVVTPRGDTYWSQCPYDDFFRDWLREKTGTTLPAQTLGFTQSYEFPSRQVYYQTEVITSCVSGIYEVEDGGFAARGQIIINLNLSALMEDIYFENGLFRQIGLVDGDGNLLCSAGDGRDDLPVLAGELGDGLVEHKGNYYFSNTAGAGGWRLVSAVSQGFLQPEGFPLMVFVAVIAGALALLFALTFPLLLRISRQIVRLDGAIASVAGGDLEVSIQQDGGPRELQNITRGFNAMVVNTRRYMAESVASAGQRQRLQFELLLAKINPHFIYNTLNSVIYLARSGKTQDIIELTSAFIYLLQDSIHLEKGGNFERLGTELEVVRKYIVIQNCRYTSRFTVDIASDPSLEDTYTLKNVLQPLIENAILHGICPMSALGHIDLTISRQDERLVIEIADNGVGMEQEKADRQLRSAAGELPGSGSKLRHIGINNIAQRLQIAFPGTASFTIRSRPGQGTRVRIAHPLLDTPPCETGGFS